MGETTFISFRAPKEQGRQLRQLAASKGVSVQDLMRALVADRLSSESNRPDLASVISRLKTCEESLRSRGVTALWIFGSVARGDANGASDVDLIVEIADGVPLSLTGFARLKQELSEMLGRAVDLAEWRTLEPRLHKVASAEAVRVF